MCVFQEEAAVLLSAHSQAVNIRHPEADALPDPSHSENSKTSASLSLSVTRSLCKSLTIFLLFFLLPLLLANLQLYFFAFTFEKSESWPDVGEEFTKEPFFPVSPDAEVSETAESPSNGPAPNLSNSPAQRQMVTPGNTPPTADEMVSPDSTTPGPDETVTTNGR